MQITGDMQCKNSSEMHTVYFYLLRNFILRNL